MKKMLIFLGLSSCVSLWCAADDTTPPCVMTAIKRWQDVAQFNNKVVAFTATSYYLNKWEYAFTLREDTADCSTVERYGVVYVPRPELPPREDGHYYSLKILFKKGALASTCFLMTQYLNYVNLAMREVTEAERVRLKEAIEKDLAELAYSSDKKQALELLNIYRFWLQSSSTPTSPNVTA